MKFTIFGISLQNFSNFSRLPNCDKMNEVGSTIFGIKFKVEENNKHNSIIGNKLCVTL